MFLLRVSADPVPCRTAMHASRASRSKTAGAPAPAVADDTADADDTAAADETAAAPADAADDTDAARPVKKRKQKATASSDAAGGDTLTEAGIAWAMRNMAWA